MFDFRERPNRWKGFLLGAVGGAVGAVAMAGYWRIAAKVFGQDPRQASGDLGTNTFNDISLIGRHHQEGESTTAAMGRIVYRWFAGRDPESAKTKTVLSYVVHYLISMLAGGLYGALRGRSRVGDLVGGLALGTALWLFGDEVGVALLGLAKGPTAFPPVLHANSFGAHVVYGLAAASATQQLEQTL